MPFLYPFLEPHLTMYCSNVGIQIKINNQIRHVYPIVKMNVREDLTSLGGVQVRYASPGTILARN